MTPILNTGVVKQEKFVYVALAIHTHSYSVTNQTFDPSYLQMPCYAAPNIGATFLEPTGLQMGEGVLCLIPCT